MATEYENVPMSGWRPESAGPPGPFDRPPPTNPEQQHRGPFKVKGSTLWATLELELEWVSLHVIKCNGKSLKRTYRTNRK